ncbi:MAG: Lrp/AsnC family transcriptional regulator [Hyphomicrobiales bacterium]|nr:Lrp/AsnC family transcriptional regulator [Hyphomicrobiales bacterium]MBV9433994.1 Lrp/AsnC family transcriptional regulator [Hyphomicrobiales bacterium]
MDEIDRRICELVQRNGQVSNAHIGAAVGVSVSTAHERVRKLMADKTITAWRAVLDPQRLGAGLCAFMWIDMSYEGEAEAKAKLLDCPQVQEMHHVSGAHSYLLKLRVPDMAALQHFLQERVKTLRAVRGTETIFALETVKETSEILISPSTQGRHLGEAS